MESFPSEEASEFPLTLEVKTDLSDDRLSPQSNVVGRLPPLSDDPSPSPLAGVPNEQDLDRHMRRLSALETVVNSLRDELQSSRDAAAQVAIAAYEGQEIVVAALRRRLDTAERVLKTTIKAQADSTPSKSFVTSVSTACSIRRARSALLSLN